jgi:amidase
MPTDTVVPLHIGPADGPRFMVKERLDVAGTPPAPAAGPWPRPPRHGPCRGGGRLLAAGWQLTGKTNLHELAYGTTGINHWTGTPRNPRWPERVPGGSSCGSAVAVAQGLVPMALGTDTGGSVRTPAACCGVFGLKPSFGRVSRQGVMPAHSSLDCVGPIARDMDTLIAAMQAMVPDFRPLPAVPPTLHIGLVDVACDAPARAAVHRACRGPPPPAPDHAAAVRGCLPGRPGGDQPRELDRLSPLLADGRMGPDVATRLQRAGQTTDAEVAEAEAIRRAFRAEVDAALSQCDVLALPTLASPPPRLEDAADTSAAVSMTALVRPFNLSGHPAITLPLDDASGLPVGLQLVARHGADEWLCAGSLPEPTARPERLPWRTR